MLSLSTWYLWHWSQSCRSAKVRQTHWYQSQNDCKHGEQGNAGHKSAWQVFDLAAWSRATGGSHSMPDVWGAVMQKTNSSWQETAAQLTGNTSMPLYQPRTNSIIIKDKSGSKEVATIAFRGMQWTNDITLIPIISVAHSPEHLPLCDFSTKVPIPKD